MAIEKIQNGMTGEAAAQLIYDNDKELENLILNFDNEEINNAIAALQAKDETHDTQITSLQNKDNALESMLGVVDERTTVLSWKSDEHDAAILALQTKDTEHDNAISALETKDLEHDTAINNVELKDQQQDEAILALQENDQQQDEAISVIPAIQQDISDIENVISDIDNAILDIDTAILDIENVIPAIQQDISDIQLKDQQQDEAILALQNSMPDTSTIEAQILALQTKDTEHDNAISALETKDLEHDTAINNVELKDQQQDEAILALQENDQQQDEAISVIPAIQQDISDIQLKDQQQDEAISVIPAIQQDISDLQNTTLKKQDLSIYVSPQGSYSGDGSFNNPYESLNTAYAKVQNGGTIVLRGGTYLMTNFNPPNKKQNITIKSFENAVINGGISYSNITKTNGYTKVYQFEDTSGNVSSESVFLWQKGVKDMNTYISFSLFYHFKKEGKECLFDDTKISKATDVADIENSATYKWFKQGSTVYFSAPSTDFENNPIVVPVGNIYLGYGTETGLKFEGITFQFIFISTQNTTSCSFIDCKFISMKGMGFHHRSYGSMYFKKCQFIGSDTTLLVSSGRGIYFENCGFSNPYPEDTQDSFSLSGFNILFNNCEFYNINKLATITQVTDVFMKNCIFRDLIVSGFTFNNNFAQAQIQNCVFFDKPKGKIFTKIKGGMLEFINNIYKGMTDTDVYSGQYMTKINDIFTP
ncbi:MAG TPA: right-handed parallel beta-helix repeat-containing protein [Bacteroidales bacterium]|nr:right-handed parallel beta-helix repeat-containing protein [Bacteroidales bacterium]